MAITACECLHNHGYRVPQDVLVTGFDDIMQVVYVDESNGRYELPLAMERKDISPLMNEWITHANPLIFTSLSFYGIPMGMTVSCLHVDRDDYCKLHQYVTAVNRAIGSFRMTGFMRYTADCIAQMAISDFLTGINNRHGFYEVLPDLLKKAAGGKLLVASVDMDGLKRINDKYGHESGDYAIKVVAEAVSRLPFEDCICGRFGGDEFVVCAVCGENPTADEQKLIRYVYDYLKDFNRKSEKEFEVSASVGTYITEAGGFDFKTALRESDEKMYLEKLGHPNRRGGEGIEG